MPWNSIFSNATSALCDLFFPKSCDLCGSPVYDGEEGGICAECADSLRYTRKPFCARCGFPPPFTLELAPEEWLCQRCQENPPPFGRSRYAMRYSGALPDAIRRFKYGGALHLGPALAGFLAEAFFESYPEETFDLIIPIPISRRRLRARGFNQSLIIARALSAKTGIAVDRRSLMKIRDTAPQASLTRERRLVNLKGSFATARGARLKGSRILLVDDVSTTGTTLSEASRVLVAAGVDGVDCLALAAASPNHGT